MAYNEQAFSYVASQAAQISSVAAALGIFTQAIAGAMAEENDAFVTNVDGIHNNVNQLLLDTYAVDSANAK